MESPYLVLILAILSAGWFLPVPPGIFGALLDYYVFGTDIHTEIKKARKGESKYITVSNIPRKKQDK
jgi:hypothetical protein